MTMTMTEIAHRAWADISPDDAFLSGLLLELRAMEAPGGFVEGVANRRRWLVASAIASVASVGLAAYEVHRIRRRRSVA